MKRAYTIDSSRDTHDESSKKRSPPIILNTSNDGLSSQFPKPIGNIPYFARAHHMLSSQNSFSIQEQSIALAQTQAPMLPLTLEKIGSGTHADSRRNAALSNFIKGGNPDALTYKTASHIKQPVTDHNFGNSSSFFSGGDKDYYNTNFMQLLLSPRAMPIAMLQQQQKQEWQQQRQQQGLMNYQLRQLNEHQNLASVAMLNFDSNMGVTSIGDTREKQLQQQIDRLCHELHQPTSQDYATVGALNRLSLHSNRFVEPYQRLSSPYQNIPDALRMSQYCASVNNSSLRIDPTELFHHKTNEHVSVKISDQSNRNKKYFRLHQPHLEGLRTTVPASLPVLLIRPVEDRFTLSAQQYLLRQQIEIFEAGEEDIMTHIRGRNKPITMGQVGIRCVHCAHVPISKRQKGSTYFPSNKLGIYQAAQNMSSTHIQCGLCEYMPEKIKKEFLNVMVSRNGSTNVGNVNGAGRPYWANSTTQLGLVDTEKGIRFIRTLLSQHPHDMIRIVDNDYM